MARPVPRTSLNRHGTPPSHLTASHRTQDRDAEGDQRPDPSRRECAPPPGAASTAGSVAVDVDGVSIGPAVVIG